MRSRLGALLCAFILVAAVAPVTITGQLLAYQDGFVFFTTGDGFRLAPSVTILDEQTKQPAKRPPTARDYARAVFNDAGEVVEIDLSDKPYPVGPLPESAEAFAVTASSPYPNPELAAPPQTTSNGVAETFSGKLVLVKFQVQVPPSTPINAEVFIATDVSGWNPQAIQMDRVDALHFSVIRRMASGTVLHFLYTRGTLQTEEVGPNGLSLKPRTLIVNDSDTNSTNSIVAQWADANSNNILQQPSVFPTPYNPAPFPNLPNGVHTPQP
ncbi:MAG TPA: hypothetical protein VMG98_13990 [Verrucomicrobiae bacterium]|nr:hypothetical protein [Verrucomicrobiae bacterium]